MLDALVLRSATLFGLAVFLLAASTQAAIIPSIFGALGFILIIFGLLIVSEEEADPNESELRIIFGFALLGFTVPLLQPSFEELLLYAPIALIGVPLLYCLRARGTIKQGVAMWLLNAGAVLFGQDLYGIVLSFPCFVLAFMALSESFQRPFLNLFQTIGLVASSWLVVIVLVVGPL